MKTLIFDCDGVLSDTERYGHLPAFNATFRELGLPVQWSEEEYGRRLKIGGGKERMASLLTPEFVEEAGLPGDQEAQLEAVSGWHKRKTAIYKALVAEGRLPGRPGIRRIVADAVEAGWQLAVASTSAQEAVEAILEYAVGKELAARFAGVYAGDVVPKKKPAPDIYLHALRELGADPDEVLVVEDSRNGLEAARAAGLRCVITLNGYTKDEDFSEALLVVSSLGDPGGEVSTVLAARTPARPGGFVTLSDLEACLSVPREGARVAPCAEAGAPASALDDVEFVVRAIAEAAIANEELFGRLDSVVGDGDFGYSLARGFERVIEELPAMDRSSIGAFLRKVGLAVASRAGGTSGPLWGTAFMRAGGAAGDKAVLSAEDVVAMLRAAVAGIQQRGGAALGEKTLLDALVPLIDRFEGELARGDGTDALGPAAEEAAGAAEATASLEAKRGRASYTGERSIGSPDAGAMAVGVLARSVHTAWLEHRRKGIPHA